MCQFNMRPNQSDARALRTSIGPLPFQTQSRNNSVLEPLKPFLKVVISITQEHSSSEESQAPRQAN